MVTPSQSYPARLEVDYPEKLDRVTTIFRLIWAIPIVIILSLLSATADSTVTTVTETGETVARVTSSGGGIWRQIDRCERRQPRVLTPMVIQPGDLV